MFSVDFDNVVQKRIESCLEVLCNKSAEYAQTERSYRDEDRLHNFKVAAELQDCTPIKALADRICDAVSKGSTEKHGKWIDALGEKVELNQNGSPNVSSWCSECKEWLVASDEYEVRGIYCPNCGAKMDLR